MADFPRSLNEFQKRFPDDGSMRRLSGRQALAGRLPLPAVRRDEVLATAQPGIGADLPVRRMPEGDFGHRLDHHAPRLHLPLTIWFWAAFLMATHSNGMSALQLQSELGLGSYKTAWLLAMKLRLATVAPGRSPLSGLVEADEAEIPFRTKDVPPAGGQGRSHEGKLSLPALLRSGGVRRENRCLAGRDLA